MLLACRKVIWVNKGKWLHPSVYLIVVKTGEEEYLLKRGSSKKSFNFHIFFSFISSFKVD